MMWALITNSHYKILGNNESDVNKLKPKFTTFVKTFKAVKRSVIKGKLYDELIREENKT